jgi:hypothetical protein
MSLEPLLRYFQGEKHAGVLCAALGLVALALALWVWRAGSPFRTMAFPLGLVALVQLAVGVGLYLRTPPQVAALTARLGGDPDAAQVARSAELARMQRVNRNFKVVEAVEVALIALSLILILALRTRPAVQGVGMGLLLQASAMLVFDLFAERRAHAYTTWLDPAAEAADG